MSRYRLFGSLCAMVFLVNFARVVFAPLIEPLRTSFGASTAAVGLIATLAWVGSASPRIPTGYLLTRVSRRGVVLAAGVVLSAAGAVVALAPSIPVLWVGAFLMGLSSGVYFTAGNPFVSELFPDRVGRALGIHGMANQLAAVAAPAVVGAVLLLGSWRLAFGATSVAALCVTVGLYVVSGRVDLPEAGVEDRDFLDAARRQWPLILTGIAILGTAGLVWQGVFNFYVSYLIAAKGLTEGAARNLLIVVFAAGVPAFVVTGRLADRFPALPLLFTIIASFIACVFVLTTLSGFLALAVMSAILGYVVHGLFPAIDTFLLGSLPDEHRASAYSVYSGGMMLVQAMGSSVVGVLVDRGLSFTVVFRGLAGALVLVLCALVGLYLTERLPTGATPAARVPADD